MRKSMADQTVVGICIILFNISKGKAVLHQGATNLWLAIRFKITTRCTRVFLLRIFVCLGNRMGPSKIKD